MKDKAIDMIKIAEDKDAEILAGPAIQIYGEEYIWLLRSKE